MNVDTTASDYDGWSAAKRSLDAALLEWGYTAATPGQEDSAAPAELGTRDIHELILDLERRAAQLQEELNGVEAKYQEHQRDLKALASKQQSSLQKQLNKRQSDLAEQNNRLTAADRKYARLERRLAAFRTAARNRPKLGPPR
jgi:Skp family chaperone for outer membrane proteins